MQLTEEDKGPLPSKIAGLKKPLIGVGVVGILLAIVWAFIAEQGYSRFGHAYIMAYCFVLTIGLGAMFLLLTTTLFRAGWSALIKRVWENYASGLLVMAFLAIPIIIFAMDPQGRIYEWSQPLDEVVYAHSAEDAYAYGQKHRLNAIAGLGDHDSHDVHDHDSHDGHDHDGEGHDHDGDEHEGHEHSDGDGDAEHSMVKPEPVAAASIHLTAAEAGGDSHAGHSGPDKMMTGKSPWLNSGFFAVRVIFYVFTFAGIALWFRAISVKQDETNDPGLTSKLEYAAPLSTLAMALALTFFTIDVILSLDWTWYSTMFGIQYFAGCMLAGMSVSILTLMLLQKQGLLPNVTVEHYHDIGKLLFAFVVFWAYVTYSQYMLIWYASIPGTTTWFAVRGATTEAAYLETSVYDFIIVLLLFGHFIIPFLGLINRRAKRNLKVLAFWCVWILVAHLIHIHWIVMPEFDNTSYNLSLIELGLVVGLASIFFAAVIHFAEKAHLVASGDPRLDESLNHEQMW